MLVGGQCVGGVFRLFGGILSPKVKGINMNSHSLCGSKFFNQMCAVKRFHCLPEEKNTTSWYE